MKGRMKGWEGYVREEGQGGRRQTTRIGAEAAASRARTTEKMGDRCYSRRNSDELSPFRAPWILALMQESTPIFSAARTQEPAASAPMRVVCRRPP